MVRQHNGWVRMVRSAVHPWDVTGKNTVQWLQGQANLVMEELDPGDIVADAFGEVKQVVMCVM